jgi:hypothetical protein
MSVPPTTLFSYTQPDIFLPFVRMALDSFREKTAVDSIDNGLCADLATTEKSSVESFDGVLTSLYTIKLEVDVTLRVWIKGNVDNMTVFLLAFSLDIVLQLFDPGVAIFSV